MKRHSNNLTWILVALLSFLVGLMLIGGYGLHLHNKEAAAIEAEKETQEASIKRQAELEKEREEEEQRKQQAASSVVAAESQIADTVPGVDVDEALGDSLTYEDLSSYAQNAEGLIKETGAEEVDSEDGKQYETSDRALTITIGDDNTHTIEISRECSYSLYHIFVGMLQTDATEYLQEKGYTQLNRSGITCYKMDDYKVLYLKFNGTRVVDISLEVDDF